MPMLFSDKPFHILENKGFRHFRADNIEISEDEFTALPFFPFSLSRYAIVLARRTARDDIDIRDVSGVNGGNVRVDYVIPEIEPIRLYCVFVNIIISEEPRVGKKVK